MKKYCIVSLLLLTVVFPTMLTAQEKLVPFFDKKGNVRILTNEVDILADTIANINHRSDDVVWSRIVYRVIDMREKQNYQLYFPMRANDVYRSLFRTMLDAVCKGVPVYRRNAREIFPSFKDSAKLEGDELSKVFAYDNNMDNNLIQINPITKEAKIVNDQYYNYVKNQYKFLIQEIIFFDKHTSRMYSKIIGIAPVYPLHPDNSQSKNPMKFFQESILCWFAFDDLRPFLAHQYIIPNGNETARLTFDEFFAQKLYGSYLLGDGNMFNRMLLESELTYDKIHKEQNRIETELLNFEEDLWEY